MDETNDITAQADTYNTTERTGENGKDETYNTEEDKSPI